MSSTENANAQHRPYILGISASHNGGACLLHGDDILVAIQEERLTRIKRDRVYASKPSLAIQYCLSSANIEVTELDLIVVCVPGQIKHASQDASLNPQLKNKRDDVEIIYAPHHLCHAISAFATSGFSRSDLLVIDGIGSPQTDLPENEVRLTQGKDDYWEGLSSYRVEDNQIIPLTKHMSHSPEVASPEEWDETIGPLKTYTTTTGLIRVGRELDSHNARISAVTIGSLGSMFEAVSLIIFGERLQAGKVMGLAAYGKPTIPVEEFLDWSDGKITYTSTFTTRFTQHRIWPENASEHQDLACSVQLALEYAVLKQVEFLRQTSRGTHLCYAGGVALNTLLNERIIRESGYEKVYIIPAAEDSGTALGAAFFGLRQLVGAFPRNALSTDNLGHNYSEQEVACSIDSLPATHFIGNCVKDRLDKVVEELCDGSIVAWFQGGAELGPRALGQRSMLCDPRTVAAKNYLNLQVKKREAFRPFAPIVLAKHALDWFDFGESEPLSPFMLRVAEALPRAKELIPAVVHFDGSARVQTVTKENGLLYPLLKRFYAKTGVPVLLNTSLNVAGEPIVETPRDVWRCLYSTPIYLCMIDQQLMVKNNISKSLLDFTATATITRYTIDKPGNKIQNSLSVNIWANSPWGELESKISIHHFFILNAQDGKRSGLQIMHDMQQDPNNPEHRQSMLDALRVLHQFHAIRFSDPDC